MITIDHNTTSSQKKVKVKKKYKRSENFSAGCKAFAGVPVKKISKETGMSREHIYEQKAKVEAYAKKLDEPTIKGKTIDVTKTFIVKTILVLMLFCRSPIEGIQRFLEMLYGVDVSTGYISGVAKEASIRAQKFDDSIRLEGIRQGANDEIFQGGTPILTGVDAVSTYCYLLEAVYNRDSETWEIFMQDCKDRGLELDVSLNDGAAALMAGISRVYPEIEIQRDVFHGKFEMGKEVSKVERKAYALIREEYELKERVDNGRPKQKTIKRLADVIPETEKAIETYDNINILYTWFNELLGFSGYELEETMALIEFVLQELEAIAVNFPGLQQECKKIRKALPSFLSFLRRLVEDEMEKSALKLGIPVDAFRMMYKQLAFGETSQLREDMEYQLMEMLVDKYDETREEFQKILGSVKKASSLVENLNGRIRNYINVKRVIPTQFLILLKVFFNTKKYRRSRIKERIGKSPLELLTGETHPEFLEALGYED